MSYAEDYPWEPILEPTEVSELLQLSRAVTARAEQLPETTDTTKIDEAPLTGLTAKELGSIPRAGLQNLTVYMFEPNASGPAGNYPFATYAWRLLTPFAVVVTTSTGLNVVSIIGGRLSVTTYPTIDLSDNNRYRIVSSFDEHDQATEGSIFDSNSLEPFAGWQERTQALKAQLAPGIGYFIFRALRYWNEDHAADA